MEGKISHPQDVSLKQPEDDELNHIVAVHRSRRLNIGNNDVSGFLQVPTAQPWNPVIAAQQPSFISLQRAHSSGLRKTPTIAFAQSDEGYYSLGNHPSYRRSVRQNIPLAPPGGSNSFDWPMAPPQAQVSLEDFLAENSHYCLAPGCDWSGKTTTDLKEHEARHKLEYVCNVSSCAQNDKGFATVNDLERHKRSVHKILPTGARMYRCFGAACKNPKKNWPRKDNFRVHLRKVHPTELEEELMRRSDTWWDSKHTESTPLQSSDHIQQLYSPFKSVGTERSSSKKVVDHAPPYSLYDILSRSPVPQNFKGINATQSTATHTKLMPGYRSTPPATFQGANLSVERTNRSEVPKKGRQQIRAPTIGGYHDNNSVPTESRPQSDDPGRLQYTISPRISKSKSVMLIDILPHRQPDAKKQPQTVADPMFLELDRLELEEYWGHQATQAAVLQEDPHMSDLLSQVGYVGSELDGSFTRTQIPQISVEPSDSAGGVAFEFNVENLKRALTSHEIKVSSSNEVRLAIKRVLQALDDSWLNAQLDELMQESKAKSYYRRELAKSPTAAGDSRVEAQPLIRQRSSSRSSKLESRDCEGESEFMGCAASCEDDSGWSQIATMSGNDDIIARTASQLAQAYLRTLRLGANNTRQHAENGGNSETRRTAGESSTTPLTRIPSRADLSNHRKRARDDDDDRDLGEDGIPSKRTKTTDEESQRISFACPYSKYDSARYSERNTNPGEKKYRKCASSYLTDIPRLKQHLYRKHKRPDFYCARCFGAFKSQTELEKHMRIEPPPCDVLDCPFAEQMNHDQKAIIKRRSDGKDQVQAWFIIWDTLFPGSSRPSSPYVEVVSTEAAADLRRFFESPEAVAIVENFGSRIAEVFPDLRQQILIQTIFEDCVSDLASQGGPNFHTNSEYGGITRLPNFVTHPTNNDSSQHFSGATGSSPCAETINPINVSFLTPPRPSVAGAICPPRNAVGASRIADDQADTTMQDSIPTLIATSRSPSEIFGEMDSSFSRDDLQDSSAALDMMASGENFDFNGVLDQGLFALDQFGEEEDSEDFCLESQVRRELSKKGKERAWN